MNDFINNESYEGIGEWKSHSYNFLKINDSYQTLSFIKNKDALIKATHLDKLIFNRSRWTQRYGSILVGGWVHITTNRKAIYKDRFHTNLKIELFLKGESLDLEVRTPMDFLYYMADTTTRTEKHNEMSSLYQFKHSIPDHLNLI